MKEGNSELSLEASEKEQVCREYITHAGKDYERYES